MAVNFKIPLHLLARRCMGRRQLLWQCRAWSCSSVRLALRFNRGFKPIRALSASHTPPPPATPTTSTKQFRADKSETIASMSSSELLKYYKIPREAVDVEGFAQECAGYMAYVAEDTEFLSKDPTLRDKVFAKLFQDKNNKSSDSGLEFLKQVVDPDTDLDSINADIAALTSPKSFEDRAVRMHLTFAALMIFNQYKLVMGLLDHPDLDERVHRRIIAIHDAWIKESPLSSPSSHLAVPSAKCHLLFVPPFTFSDICIFPYFPRFSRL
ncbi:hypothetical protein OG21DRAFT_367230 [Imleria badia]|nr:hypothetical protein OG21DRAFT_367230 [Imleria badia]